TRTTILLGAYAVSTLAYSPPMSGRYRLYTSLSRPREGVLHRALRPVRTTRYLSYLQMPIQRPSSITTVAALSLSHWPRRGLLSLPCVSL
ncbi:hypothetical protein EV714DRAFT_241937, partial [Schizophyllum commune]